MITTFARDVLGQELWPEQVSIIDAWEESGKRKGVLCLGRRSGKSLMADCTAIENAVVPDLSAYLRVGETRFILIFATNAQQAREHIRVIKELVANALDSDIRTMIDSEASTTDEVVFRNGVVIRAMPCSSRAGRGLACSMILLDEFGHFVDASDGYQAARNVYRAVSPSIVQFQEHGRILITSTPLWPSGAFYDLYTQGESGADVDTFVVKRPTWDVNPNVTRASLDGEFLADPEGAEVEFGANWSAGLGAFMDPVTCYSSVVKDRKSLPYIEGIQYSMCIDPAFAAGGDNFALAVGHRQGETYVIDRLRTWRGREGPLNSDEVLDTVAAIAKEFNVDYAVSDQFSVVTVSDALRRRGVTLKAEPLTSERKADIMTSMKRATNLGRVEFLDSPELLNELVHLELRKSPSGKPRIAAASGHHDDRAMVVATVIHTLETNDNPVKWLGSKGGAFADAWVRHYADIAREAEQPPQITTRVVNVGQ